MFPQYSFCFTCNIYRAWDVVWGEADRRKKRKKEKKKETKASVSAVLYKRKGGMQLIPKFVMISFLDKQP